MRNATKKPMWTGNCSAKSDPIRLTGREKPLVETVIKPHLDSLVTDPEICAAILGGKSMKTVAADVWSRAEKKKVNSGAYIPDEEIRDIVEEYYRK